MVALKERGQVDPGRMVTHRLGFDVKDVNKAYQMYEQRLENVIKVVMDVGASNMAKTSLTSVGS
jgi:threonine dehydrogenase-like Zn-dependent dehydrogenase